MATSVDATTTTLETTDDAVEVIVVCTPPTSLASRDCTSPERVAVKKASESCLEVREEAVAQVLHDLVADDVREVRLGDAEHARDQGDRHERRDEDLEQADVRPPADEQRVVEDRADQQRGHDAERRADEDGREDERQLRPVGAEAAR